LMKSPIEESRSYEMHEVDSDLLASEGKRLGVKPRSAKAKQNGNASPYPMSLTVKFRDRRSAEEFGKLVRVPLSFKVREFTFNPSAKRSKSDGFTGNRGAASRAKEPQENWIEPWRQAGMPEFVQEKARWEFFRVRVLITSRETHIAFANLVRQHLTLKTKSIYFPQWTPAKLKEKKWVSDLPVSEKNPRYPVFIISRGRAFSRYTAKAFEEIGVPYFIVVEPKERDDYAHFIDDSKILVLPYDSDPKAPTGAGRARNWCWDYSKEILKARRHWVFDDNITAFYRLHKNKRIKVGDGAMFRACEDFVDRYENVRVAGLQYRFFCAAKDRYPAFVANTRIFSALLIDNEGTHRWRGRYNEDVILSLDVLSDGDCTVQFNNLLQGKMGTQALSGGNTDFIYNNDELNAYAERFLKDDRRALSTLNKSVSLKQLYPELIEVVWRYGRVHHEADFSSFKDNQLRLKKGAKKVKDYKLRLINMTDDEAATLQESIDQEEG